MTRGEKRKIIEDVIRVHQKLEEEIMSLIHVVGGDGGCLGDAASNMSDVLCTMAARLLGLHINENKEGGETILHWYIWENECGVSGLDAGFDGETKPIRTVDDLMDFIEEGQRRE